MRFGAWRHSWFTEPRGMHKVSHCHEGQSLTWPRGWIVFGDKGVDRSRGQEGLAKHEVCTRSLVVGRANHLRGPEGVPRSGSSGCITFVAKRVKHLRVLEGGSEGLRAFGIPFIKK